MVYIKNNNLQSNNTKNMTMINVMDRLYYKIILFNITMQKTKLWVAHS